MFRALFSSFGCIEESFIAIITSDNISHCFGSSLVRKPTAEFLVEASVENETGNRSDFESKTCLGSLRVLENVPYIEILVQLVSSLFCAGYQLSCLLFTFADFKNSHSVLMGRDLLILLCPITSLWVG